MKNLVCKCSNKKLQWLNALFVTGFLVILMSTSFVMLANDEPRTLREYLAPENAPECVKLTNVVSDYTADDLAGSIGSVCIVPGEGAMVNQTYL